MNLLRSGVFFSLGLGFAATLDACGPVVVRVASEDAGSDAVIATPDASVMPPPTDAATPGDGAVKPSGDASMPTPTDVATDATPDPMQGAGSVDLVLLVDNSNSMRASQEYLQQYVSNLTNTLLDEYHVTDVRVAVVSSDLGTPGSVVPSCARSDGGDDGYFNPRANGGAMHARGNLPPALCTPEQDARPWMTFSSSLNVMERIALSGCQLNLGVGGCGIEQQLEAVRRALIEHGEHMPNVGFLRRDATLAILMLTDEEDGSVRDCRHHDGVGRCIDATTVFDITSPSWSSLDLNLRFYTYSPGGGQDPTWPLERYVDPSNLNRGFLSLKPGHPERIVFGAITGVPVAVPRTASGATDWDQLLGPAAAGRPDDFNARDSTAALYLPMASGGALSMRQADTDPECPQRLIPACRVATTSSTRSCDVATNPFAWRARRIAEVARRFDESALCNGTACHNGMVASICDRGNGAPFTDFARMVGRRVVR